MFQKQLDSKVVQCQLCNHFCKIALNCLGICGVRKNINGTLYSTVYDKTSGVGLDPIEKKPFFHFLPGSYALSVGTIGCNFGCDFCQNDWISQIGKDKEVNHPLLKDISSEELITTCVKEKIPTIAYTYNEPVVFFEFAYDTAILAKAKGIKNVFVSNGYASKAAIDKISPYLDGINIDLKSFSNEFYRKICKGSLKPVLENIERYYQNGVWVEVTSLLIPGKNDSDKEVKEMARFIKSVSSSIPWHISGFTPSYKMMNTPSTPKETLLRAYRIGKEVGLKYVYTGNTLDKSTQSTYCPKCKALLIERDWTLTTVKDLKNGRCAKCREKIEGVWK